MTFIRLLLALMFCASSVVGQGGGSLKTGNAAVPDVPEKGSVERKAIVDALRVPVGKQGLGQRIPGAEGNLQTIGREHQS